MSQSNSASPRVKILLVDDEQMYHTPVILVLTPEGYQVDVLDDGVQAMNILQKSHYDVILLDINMPRVGGMEILRFVKEHYPSTEVIMFTGVHDVKTAVECMREGAFNYVTKPFSQDELLTVVARAIEHRNLVLQNTLMQARLERVAGNYSIIGTGPAISKVLKTCLQIAPSETSVLIQGPSGTGKELIAHFIHRNSNRAKQPFVPINCASIPDNLFESELFGHERGAFTDAKGQKVGLVEMANNGTLFLDEIGDISPMVQPKLLRFIQTGEFRRVGGTIALNSNVRVVSATNKNIAQEVKEGRFREDLLYRLNVITIDLPSLKERKEDIPLIVDHFLKERFQQALQKTVSEEAMQLMVSYDWPGNIRELENVVERASLLSTGKIILPKDLLLPSTSVRSAPSAEGETPIGSNISLSELEKMHIVAVLHATGWNKNETSKILAISLKTLYTKISAYQLKQE